MKLGRLALTMLRYRVAVMIWMFMLLGSAAAVGAVDLGRRSLLALLAMAGSYICATTINDLADRDIDSINHPNDPARPLVTGAAEGHEMVLLSVVAGVMALVAGILVDTRSAAWVAVGLFVAYAYSAPPLRISYRTHIAPLFLTVGYVAVPFALGFEVGRGSWGTEDFVLGAALCSLFLSRIVLKDFRDREGDAACGRPTFLLRYGKPATCAISFGFLLLGDALLIAGSEPSVPVALVLQSFVVAIAVMLARLARANVGRDEQLAIGMGARMGNGLLLCVLASILLEGARAPFEHQIAFTSLVAASYLAGLYVLLSRPDEIAIAYKG